MVITLLKEIHRDGLCNVFHVLPPSLVQENVVHKQKHYDPLLYGSCFYVYINEIHFILHQWLIWVNNNRLGVLCPKDRFALIPSSSNINMLSRYPTPADSTIS